MAGLMSAMSEGDIGVSVELQQLVQERMQAEVQALKVKFTLCFVSILFALTGAGLLWGGLKKKRARDRRARLLRAGINGEDTLQQGPSTRQTRTAQHLLRRVRRREGVPCARLLTWACSDVMALTRGPACVRSCRAPCGTGRQTEWSRARAPSGKGSRDLGTLAGTPGVSSQESGGSMPGHRPASTSTATPDRRGWQLLPSGKLLGGPTRVLRFIRTEQTRRTRRPSTARVKGPCPR